MPRARSIAPAKVPKVAEASRLSSSQNQKQDASATLSPAPKGRNIPAQGGNALGNRHPTNSSPEGAAQGWRIVKLEDVVVPDQLRTVIRTFREKLFTEIFTDRPARAKAMGLDEPWVPKTLIFAKDDSHAEDIVDIVRKEFGKGNDFCKKVTYRASGKSEDIIKAFRTAPEFRIAVTVEKVGVAITHFNTQAVAAMPLPLPRQRPLRRRNPSDLSAAIFGKFPRNSYFPA